MINTKKVRDRRRLRFDSLGAAIRDAESLAEAENRGALRAAGNWTLGQTLGHLAFWAEAPFDGYPEGLPEPPWLLRRVVFPMMKGRFLNKGLPAGAHIPSVPKGTFGVDVMPTDQGLFAMRAAFTRLANQEPTIASPIFGPMSHEDWLRLNLRHAELHLSFLHAG